MFFPLHQPVTKNQLLNYSVHFFVLQLKQLKKRQSGLFSFQTATKRNKQRNLVHMWFLVTGWCNNRNIKACFDCFTYNYLNFYSNVWCIKNRTNHSSKTLMSLVRFLMHQTLQCLEISRAQSLEFSRRCTIEISR